MSRYHLPPSLFARCNAREPAPSAYPTRPPPSPLDTVVRDALARLAAWTDADRDAWRRAEVRRG